MPSNGMAVYQKPVQIRKILSGKRGECRFEPASSAWEAEVVPLNNTRKSMFPIVYPEDSTVTNTTGPCLNYLDHRCFLVIWFCVDWLGRHQTQKVILKTLYLRAASAAFFGYALVR